MLLGLIIILPHLLDDFVDLCRILEVGIVATNSGKCLIQPRHVPGGRRQVFEVVLKIDLDKVSTIGLVDVLHCNPFSSCVQHVKIVARDFDFSF